MQDGRLNYSMHFDLGEIKKFERHLEQAFSKKKYGRNKLNAMSMDNSMLNDELMLEDFKNKQSKNNFNYNYNN